MGVRRSELEEVPSIALGTSEVSLLEMVAGYSTLASGGVYRPPVMVTQIYDRHGELVYEAPERERRVISEETALRVVDMMQGVVDRGTGTRIRNTFGIRGEVAGKTGTTQNNADGWFILMHPELVAGAWVGFNDPRIAFRSDYWGQGGNNALFLVGEFFRRALNDRSTGLSRGDFPEPPPLPEGPGSLIARIGDWIGEAASDVGAFFGSIFRYVGEKVFGIAPEDEQVLPPEQRGGDRRRGLRYASDETIEDEGWEAADSLTRIQRDSLQLADILARMRERSAGAGDGATPQPSAPAGEDVEGGGGETPANPGGGTPPGPDGEGPPGPEGEGPPGQQTVEVTPEP
jgi:penicillin-binding protein 1A